MVRRRRIAEALQRAWVAQGGLPTGRRGRMQRKRDHGAQRPRHVERDRPLHQGGGSGAARAQCDDEGGHPMIRRREFITVLGGAAAAWPLVARAQQPGKLPTIGFLGATTPLVESQRLAAFVQRLRELGWMEGRNVAIEVRWAEGRSGRFAEIAAELVRLKVDVILTHNTPPVLAAKQATSVIPIVFASAGDPVGSGVVASLARPVGNVTGLSSASPDVVGKRLELLREVVPSLRRLAIIGNAGNPLTVLQMGEVQAAARTLGLEVITLEIRRAENIASAFETVKGRAEALYVMPDPVMFIH